MTRMPLLLLLLGASWMLAAAPAAGQTPQPKRIQGTYKVVAHSFFGWTEELSGSVVMELEEVVVGTEHYRLVEATANWSAYGTRGECTFSGGPTTVSVAPQSNVLRIYPDSTYTGAVVSNELMFTQQITEACPARTNVWPNMQAVLFDAVSIDSAFFPLRDNGTLLQETRTILALPGEATYEWSFTTRAETVELVVTFDDYDTWIPEGGPNERLAGNGLIATAELRTTDGSPPAQQAASFRFDLVDTSREPGVSLNFPLPAQARATYDLKITSAVDAVETDTAGQWVVTKGGRNAFAGLSAFDNGAYATLRVTAVLENGRTVVGHLDGDPARTDILLPRRQPGSLVADRWKELQGVVGMADDDDSDPLPQGDGHAGDGLTLYEEYRGFRENGRPRPLRTNPKRKDLFVFDQIGGFTKRGLALYAALSELDVHHELTEAEFDTLRRVINANHAAGPHRVDQHGLWLKTENASVGRANGRGPGPPKLTDSIQVAYVDYFSVLRRGAKVLTDAAAPHVAHELFHGTGVWHHGEADLGRRSWSYRMNGDSTRFERDAAGRLIVLENGSEIQVRRENGTPYTPLLLDIRINGRPLQHKYWVGMEHGQHSGHEDCVMRYHVAQAYGRDPNLRYWLGDHAELDGIGLCRSPAGTGVNAAGRTPRPRYGDADPSPRWGPTPRGNCRSQICVNDAYH